MIKKPLALTLAAFLLLCTGCTAANAEIIPANQESVDSPYNYAFPDVLLTDENGQYYYPDSFAGQYLEGDTMVFSIVGNDFSEYEHLKDKYPSAEFRSAEYSYNYLKSLLDKYDDSGDTVFCSYVSVTLNRTVIEVDEKTLSTKQFYETSPLIFKLGSPMYAL